MTPTESQANPSQSIYYPGIQDLRGWAALCVLLYHTHVLFRKEKYFGAEVFWGLFEFGHRGVDLFFVISGFLMAMLTQERAQRHQPGFFLLARARRIYIPYLPVLTVLSLTCLLSKNICPSAYAFDAKTMLFNAFIVPREDLNTFVPVVAWTLAHEMFFYLMTFVSLLFMGVGRIVFFTWLAVSTMITLVGIELPFPWSFVLGPYNIAFGLGFLAFKLKHAYSSHIPSRTCLWTGAVGLLFLGCVESFLGEPARHMAGVYFMLAFFFVSFLLVLGFCGRSTRFIRPLGNASYSIYLVHYPLLVVLCMLARRFLGGTVPVTPLFFLVVALALAGGGLYYLLVERPSLRLFSRRLGS